MSIETNKSTPVDFLSLKVGGSKTYTKVIRVEHSPVDNRVFIHTETSDGRRFKCNEIWLRDHTGEVTWKTLFLNFDSTGSNILAGSNISKLLEFYNVETLGDLVGKEILLEPKSNGFLAIVAYE
jgi:hypothetical protein